MSKSDSLNDGPWMTGKWSVDERIKAIAAFLTVFTASGFNFGEWISGPEKDGITQMPWFSLGRDAQAFYKAAYDYGWVQNFAWMEWRQTPEAIALRDQPDILAGADPQQLANLLTALIRADRFCEGSLASDFESGLLTRIIARASALCNLSSDEPVQ